MSEMQQLSDSYSALKDRHAILKRVLKQQKDYALGLLEHIDKLEQKASKNEGEQSEYSRLHGIINQMNRDHESLVKVNKTLRDKTRPEVDRYKDLLKKYHSLLAHARANGIASSEYYNSNQTH